MHDRAISTVESADRVILLHDSTDPSPYLEASRTPDLIVHTKSDLRSHAGLSVSAHTGENMPEFCRRLDELAFGAATGNTLAINARHIQSIEDARAALDRAREGLADGAELLAIELREALDALGAILGQVTPDDVLGRIFSSFCIGK